MDEIIAIDIDLGKATAVSSVNGVRFHLKNPLGMIAWPMAPTILLEIAGPIMHRGGDQRTLHHTHRWMLYNAAVVGRFVESYAGSPEVTRVLVATSTDWTQGYTEVQRHEIAGMKPRKISKSGAHLYGEPHDVRECRAMIYFYSKNPSVWKPLDHWLGDL